jgi:hypothetical protein
METWNIPLAPIFAKIAILLRRVSRAIERAPAEIEPGLICTNAEQKVIVQWVMENHQSFIPNGNARCFQPIHQRPDIPPEVQVIRDRIIDREGLGELKELRPPLPDFISHVSLGGKIHPHTDPNSGELFHIRFNVFLQLPERGGRPIYGGTRLEPLERSYLPCVAGRDLHTCEVVEGSKARIALSFGFLVSRDWLSTRGV